MTNKQPRNRDLRSSHRGPRFKRQNQPGRHFWAAVVRPAPEPRGRAWWLGTCRSEPAFEEKFAMPDWAAMCDMAREDVTCVTYQNYSARALPTEEETRVTMKEMAEAMAACAPHMARVMRRIEEIVHGMQMSALLTLYAPPRPFSSPPPISPTNPISPEEEQWRADWKQERRRQWYSRHHLLTERENLYCIECGFRRRPAEAMFHRRGEAGFHHAPDCRHVFTPAKRKYFANAWGSVSPEEPGIERPKIVIYTPILSPLRLVAPPINQVS